MTRAFDLLPAIDLRRGRVVRLEQGDFDRETSFGDDPVGTAARFVDGGARWLHVVDLDAARSGGGRQTGVIAAIVRAVEGRAAVEVAGGLRTADAVAAALDAGSARAVVGTIAVEEPDLVGRLIARHGDGRIAVAVDVRDGVAVGRGWQSGAPGVDPAGLLRRLAAVGVTTFEVTAVARDGLMGGPDLDLLEGLVGGGGTVIASGGVRGVDDLGDLRRIGCAGAIVGRALYDGSLSLDAAISATL